MEMTRRSLVAGMGVVGSTIAASTLLNSPSIARAEEAVQWDEEYDIVVIGSGYTGECASIEAADAGSSVIVLEKAAVAGGNSILCGGNAQMGGGTSIQQAAGIEDTPEAFYEELYNWGQHRANPALLHSFTDNCAEHVEWMKSVGVEFNPELTTQELSIARTHMPSEGMGNTYWYVFKKALDERGVEIRTNAGVTGLEFDENGAACGVDVGDQRIKANQAVIIASGGWKGSTAMCQHFDPRMDEDFTSSGEPYANVHGDLQRMVVDAGGSLVDMSFVCETARFFGARYYQFWDENPEHVPDYACGLTNLDTGSIIVVDGSGNRFVDEAKLDNDTEGFNDAYLSLTIRPRNVWAITDAPGAESAGWDTEAIMAPSFEEPGEGHVRLNEDMVAYADTLEELAEKIGVDAEGLAATVEKYNGFAESGTDEDFGKESITAPIATGPFYAGKFQFMTHDQMGGITVNTKGQVIKRSAWAAEDATPLDECEVIPHLYAAGEAAGGFWGVWRGHGKIGCYMIQGRHAAQAAVQEPKI